MSDEIYYEIRDDPRIMILLLERIDKEFIIKKRKTLVEEIIELLDRKNNNY